jgi:hypothetical protein
LEDIREKININNRIIHFRDNISKFENINDDQKFFFNDLSQKDELEMFNEDCSK